MCGGKKRLFYCSDRSLLLRRKLWLFHKECPASFSGKTQSVFMLILQGMLDGLVFWECGGLEVTLRLVIVRWGGCAAPYMPSPVVTNQMLFVCFSFNQRKQQFQIDLVCWFRHRDIMVHVNCCTCKLTFSHMKSDDMSEKLGIWPQWQNWTMAGTFRRGGVVSD